MCIRDRFSKKAPVVTKPKKKINTKKFDEVARAKDKNESNKIVGTETEINEKNRPKVQAEVLDAFEKNDFDENVFNAGRFNNSGAKRKRLENGDVVYDLTNGETIPGIPSGKKKWCKTI